MTTTPPCNSCTICCYQQMVLLMPEDEERLAFLTFDEVKIEEKTFRVLKTLPGTGACVHLGPTGCTVYENRPEVCRAYDCRKQFLVMTRNQRRGFKNQKIWVKARSLLDTLDQQDRDEIAKYYTRATNAEKTVFGEGEEN